MKQYRFLFLNMLMVFILLTTVSATIFIENDVFYAEYKQNGQLQTTTQPITQVNAIGFVCMNADCSQIGQQIFNSQTLFSHNTNRIQTFFPNDPLYTSNHGYGVYIFKDGYIPYEQKITASNPNGDYYHSHVQQTKLAKVEMCRSVIDSFSVTNTVHPNQPVMVDILTSLDSTVHSPIAVAGPLNYVPSQIREHYQVQTQVVLEIVDSQGTVINTQSESVQIDFSGEEQVQFSYVPQDTGAYSARVVSTVTDDKCLDSESHFSQKDFTVIHEGETQMCYALVQNLQVSPQYPEVGNELQTSVEFIANTYDFFGELDASPVELDFSVQKNGSTIHTENRILSSATSIDTFRTTEFIFNPTESGYYTVSVEGSVKDCQFGDPVSDTISQSIYVEGSSLPPSNQAPTFNQIPDQEFVVNSGLQSNILNLQNYAFDADGDSLTFSIVNQSHPNRSSCLVTSSGLVSCTALSQLGNSTVVVRAHDGTTSTDASFVVSVVPPPNQAPTFNQIPNVELDEDSGLNQNIFDLQNYTFDADGDTLTFAIVNQTNPQLVNCFLTNSVLHCDVQPDQFGQSVITVSAFDGVHTVFEQFTVVVAESVILPQANFPNVTLSENSGFNSQIFNFFDYITHPNLTSFAVFWNITQTRSDIVDCFVNGSYLECDVQPNMVGVNEVEVWFTANAGANVASDTFTVTIIDEPNQAPTFNQIPDQEFVVNSGLQSNILNLQNYAFDADGDSLTFSIVNQSHPNRSSCLVTSSGLVSCTALSQLGNSTVVVRAHDGTTSTDASFVVSVVPPPNQAPTFNQIPNVELDEDSGLNQNIFDLQNYTFDADGDTLTFAIVNQTNPQLVNCFLTNSVLHCDVQPDQFGQSVITVSAFDGVHTVFEQFTVVVAENPNEPTESNIPNGQLKRNEQNVVLFNLSDNAFDPDGSNLTFAIVQESNKDVVRCKIEQESIFICSAQTNRIGSSNVVFAVSDGIDTVHDMSKVTVVQDFPQLESTMSDEDINLKIPFIQIPDVVYQDRETEFTLSIRFENDGNVDLDNIKAIISIPELGIHRSVYSDLLRVGQVDTKRVVLPLYHQVQSGYYTIRIVTGSNQKTQRTIHREVYIQ